MHLKSVDSLYLLNRIFSCFNTSTQSWKKTTKKHTSEKTEPSCQIQHHFSCQSCWTPIAAKHYLVHKSQSTIGSSSSCPLEAVLFWDCSPPVSCSRKKIHTTAKKIQKNSISIQERNPHILCFYSSGLLWSSKLCTASSFHIGVQEFVSGLCVSWIRLQYCSSSSTQYLFTFGGVFT